MECVAACGVPQRAVPRSGDYGGYAGCEGGVGGFQGVHAVPCGGSYKVTPQFTVNAAVYNLFNKDFVDYTAYTVPGAPAVTNYRNLYTNSQDGRRLWLSANYEF